MRHFDSDTWKITNLNRLGWQTTVDTVAEMVDTVSSTASEVEWNTATVILQLFDNSVYMVGSPGGKKKLPSKEGQGTYHIDSSLVVADKLTVKELVNILSLLY
jgi:hypothetical protein